MRKSQRLFRLDRIAQAALTDETFSRPDNSDARTAVQRALATVQRVWQIEVWLAMSLLEAQRSLRLPQAFFEKEGDGILFRCEVSDLPWMAHKLAGLGMPFIIKNRFIEEILGEKPSFLGVTGKLLCRWNDSSGKERSCPLHSSEYERNKRFHH